MWNAMKQNLNFVFKAFKQYKKLVILYTTEKKKQKLVLWPEKYPK